MFDEELICFIENTSDGPHFSECTYLKAVNCTYSILWSWKVYLTLLTFIFPSGRLKKKTCICRDSPRWKTSKAFVTEKMNWGWEWKLLKSTISLFFYLTFSHLKCWLKVCIFLRRTCQIHAEKVKTAEELLRRRELAVKTMEDTYEQKLKNELSR